MDVINKANEMYGTDFISEIGFSCMLDMLLKLRLMNLVFLEIPLILRYDRKVEQSKMNVSKTVFQTLSLIWRRKINFFRL